MVPRRIGGEPRKGAAVRNVDASRVNADYEHGVLTIVLPKTEESKPRRVQISTGDGAQQITTGERR